MDNENKESVVEGDQIRITIEIGEGYNPTQRVAGALDELATALQAAAEEPEVSGFGLLDISFTRGTAYMFDSSSFEANSGPPYDHRKIPAPPAPFVPASPPPPPPKLL